MRATMIAPRLVDRTLETHPVGDLLAVHGKRLRPRIMHDAYLVAHRVPKRWAPLAYRQIRVVQVRQPHGVRAKVEIQECLLGLSGRETCVVYARTHALEGRVVRVEDEDARVEVELEARVLVYVWDGAEREGQVEELVKVAPDKRVRVQVDHTVHAQDRVKRPEVQLGVLVAEAAADAGAVVRRRDKLHFERLPACCARDAKRARGDASGDVEEDAAGGGAGLLDGVAESCDGNRVQVVVERADDCSRAGIGIRHGRPRGELRFSVMARPQLEN